MTDNSFDDRLREVLRSAELTISPREGWEQRAASEMARATQRGARSPRRRMLVAIGALLGLLIVGLGFVPFPVGKATGALGRAVAMMSVGDTVHVTSRSWYSDDTSFEMEEWMSADGFYRQESRENGQLTMATLAEGPWELHCSLDELGTPRTSGSYDPTGLHPQLMPYGSELERRFEWLRHLAEWRGAPEPELAVTEQRVVSAWGGPIDVVDIEWTVGTGGAYFMLGSYSEGDCVRVRAHVDADTDRLLRVEQFREDAGAWERTCEVSYEWDVEIPESVRHLELPAGISVTWYTWWEKRAEQIIAQAETRDWVVTLHAIDIQRNGDVVLSVSRVETPDSEMPLAYNSAPPLVVEGIGSPGELYAQQNYYGCYNARRSGYWTTTLKPEDPGALPRSLTLTIWPYRESPSEEQFVVFPNVPLPPRQDVNDLYAAEKRVVQY